MAMINIV